MGKSKRKKINGILSTVTKAKNEGLRTNVDGREITLDNTKKLLKDLGNGILDEHEFKNRYKDIFNDVEAIVNRLIIARKQEKIVEIMSLLKEILKAKSNEQLDTKDMPELESEESTAERRNQQRLKILTPDQMLSRLQITLARLKAGNNSQKLINESRQLLYSLYHSKKLTKTIYKHLINAI